MKIVKRTRKNAVVKLEKGEGYADVFKYMVICNYDDTKAYCGLDGDIYKRTYKEAVESAYSWDGLV